MRRKNPACFGAATATAVGFTTGAAATGSAGSSRSGAGAAGAIRVTAGCSPGSAGCVEVGSGVGVTGVMRS